MVKKGVAVFLAVMVFLCLLSSVVWGVICVNDYQNLVNNPTTDSIEFLALGIVYAIGFFVLGMVGFVTAAILPRLTKTEAVKVTAHIAMILFAVEVFASLALAFN